MSEMVKCFFCAEEILADAKKCKHCGEWVRGHNPPGVLKSNITPPVKKPEPKTGLQKEYGIAGWGVILLLLGGVAAVYFGFFFDTSVEVPRTEILGHTFGGQRVNNLGLMQDRQNFLMMSCAVVIVGVIMSIAGSLKKPA